MRNKGQLITELFICFAYVTHKVGLILAAFTMVNWINHSWYIRWIKSIPQTLSYSFVFLWDIPSMTHVFLCYNSNASPPKYQVSLNFSGCCIKVSEVGMDMRNKSELTEKVVNAFMKTPKLEKSNPHCYFCVFLCFLH